MSPNSGKNAPNTPQLPGLQAATGTRLVMCSAACRREMPTFHAAAMRILTTYAMTDARVNSTLGVVVGIAIRSRGVGGNIMAGLDALGCDSALDEYRDLLTACRHDALARMEQEARSIGATAVIGVRFDSAEVGREMVEVVAYGTAVVLQDE